MHRAIVLPLLVLLAACGTPQEQCIRTGTRDLRTLDRLIAETQGNLDRGYAYETITIYEEFWDYCPQPQVEGQPPVPPRLCLNERPIQVDRPKAIDLVAEAQKLAGMQAKRSELQTAAQAIVAQCKAEHPE